MYDHAASKRSSTKRRVPLSMSHIGLYVHDLPRWKTSTRVYLALR